MMPIKLEYRGIAFTVSNPSEAAALARELTEQPPPKNKGGRPKKADKPERPRPIVAKRLAPESVKQQLFPVEDEARERAIRFLSLIEQAGNHGVAAHDLMKVIDAKHIKGVGSRMASINAVLMKHGIRPGDVYDNPRTRAGRLWRPRKQVHSALTAIRNGGAYTS